MSLTTGLPVGLAWGLLAALLEGLPLLLQGSVGPHLGSRLLALAYLATIYGLLGAVTGGLLGLVTLVFLRVARRRLSRGTLAAIHSGLFAAAIVLVLWAHRFEPKLAGWLVVAPLAAGLGLATAWLLNHAARGGAVSWKFLRGAVLGVFLVALVAVLAAAGHRTLLRDKPLFDPPVTDQVATPQQPNIVLITADGLRPDHLGAYGYGEAGEPEISPNIDALAGRGIRFEQAIAQASWTEPSLASMLTSLHPSELGIDCRAALSCQPHIDERRLTLAETLKGAGYRTQAHVTSPWLIADLGFDQGFDHFQSVRAQEPFDEGPMRDRTLGRLLACGQDAPACRLFLQGHKLIFDTPLPLEWGGDHVNAHVTRFLELHRDERFFLWLHYTEALPPYNLEPPFRPLPEGPLASSERKLEQIAYWELGDPFTPREELLPLDVEGLTALYDGEVHRVDRLVGGVTGLLDAFGLSGRTLLVLTSDHGQELMDHGGYTHGHSLYDEVLRVPLIVAGPGVASPGRAVDTPVSLLDLAPTLAEIAGASASPEAEGRSLVPALRGEDLEAQPIFSESLYRVPHELKAVRQDGYKLIYHVDDGSMELYDLNADPTEQQNAVEKATQVAEAMKNRLLDWMAYTAQMADELPRDAPPAEFKDAVW